MNVNDREHTVACAKIRLRQAESRLKTCQRTLDMRERESQAAWERELSDLTDDIEQAECEVETEKACLKLAESELENPYRSE